uniref:uncharacterized protein isoform X2 n=1 Tax=Semicossyphus pulcher TaxID=241346 RepID=UPI0037E74750
MEAVCEQDHGGEEEEEAMLWSIQEALERQTLQIGASACGATAVVDVLKALGVEVTPEEADRSVQTRLRRNESPLPDYLLSRSEAGATHAQLIQGAEEASKGKVIGRFFHLHPHRLVRLVSWLARWIRKVSETELHQRLCSESVLLIRREDVLQRLTPECCLSSLSDVRWKALDVEGQVKQMCREEEQEEDGAKLTHITIPAAYSSGVTLFALRQSALGQELLSAPELPLL